jgi:nuclear transport factor 2 (NTF2) superfamily protein
MQSKNVLEKRTEMLENGLEPEQKAKIAVTYLDRVWNDEISLEEASEEIEKFVKKHVNRMGVQPHFEYTRELFKLVTNAWFCRYLKEVIKRVESEISFSKTLLAFMELVISFQDYEAPELSKAWLEHCKKHPEDKNTEERVKEFLEWFRKKGRHELEDKLNCLIENREMLLNSDIWDKIGYLKPSSSGPEDVKKL